MGFYACNISFIFIWSLIQLWKLCARGETCEINISTGTCFHFFFCTYDVLRWRILR